MSVCPREQAERDLALVDALRTELAQARWELSILRAEREETLAVAADAIAAVGSFA